MYYIKYQQLCLRAREGEDNVTYSTLHTSPRYFPAIKGRLSQLKLEEYNSFLLCYPFPGGYAQKIFIKQGCSKIIRTSNNLLSSYTV